MLLLKKRGQKVKQPRLIKICLFVTSCCNRGCRHCNSDSNMQNPIYLTAEKIDMLLDNLQKSGVEAIICLTGGGEPLLNEHLPLLVRKVCEASSVQSCTLVTSGFLNNEGEKRKLAQTIDFGGEKLRINLSFHPFMRRYIKRFKESFEFLLNTDVVSFVVKVTSGENDDVHDDLDQIFYEFRVRPYLIEPNVWEELFPIRFSSPLIGSETTIKILNGLTLLAPARYVCARKKKWIVVTTQMLESRGRARLMRQPSIEQPYCGAVFNDDEPMSFALDCNGNFFFYRCDTKATPNMVVGTLHEDIRKIIY